MQPVQEFAIERVSLPALAVRLVALRPPIAVRLHGCSRLFEAGAGLAGKLTEPGHDRERPVLFDCVLHASVLVQSPGTVRRRETSIQMGTSRPNRRSLLP